MCEFIKCSQCMVLVLEMGFPLGLSCGPKNLVMLYPKTQREFLKLLTSFTVKLLQSMQKYHCY